MSLGGQARFVDPTGSLTKLFLVVNLADVIFLTGQFNKLLPLRLVGGMGGLGQLLGGGGEPLLGPLQVLLQQLDPPVQGGDLTLGL